jgi:hypothetical protein
MYGINRISAYMEVEYEKGRLNNHSSKRLVIHCLVSIPCAGNFTLRKEYKGRVGLLTESGNFQKSPIPNSGTPQNLLTLFNNTSRFKNDHQNKSNTQPLLERLTNHIQYDKFLPKSMGQEPTNNNQFVSIGTKIQRDQML